MKWQSVKSVSEIRLKGVQVEFETHDKQLKGVVLASTTASLGSPTRV